jgi:RHS repeat-associated protein
MHLVTTRPNHPETDKRTLQDLRYTYDPAGNITHIQDDAQQTIYFRNQRVEPSNDYVYDAVYRLLSAKGREHLGQTGGQRNPPTAPDAFNQFHTHPDDPGDGNALGLYIEEYEYDAVGNFKAMHHRGSDPAHPGWTRSYAYNEPSLLEPAKQSNRLSFTQIGEGTPERYTYDDHGNMTVMPHLPTLRWDFEDQLTQVDLQGGGTAYYVYDAAGQRVRKVIERNGATVEERIYLGGYEVYRKRQGGVLQLERQTLHIMDDKQRIALVETRTQGNDGSPPQLFRYQFGNHLGSASLELDDEAKIISYEEYFPYGSTSYQAVHTSLEKNPKRYRYTGMERDEESGLEYHSARYYAPWLGRWTSTDPAGLVDGLDLYSFARNSPVNLRDVSGTDSRIGTLVEYKEKGQGLPKGFEQLHFFPASVQLKINPGWTRGLSETYKELVFVGSASLNRTIDAKLRKYAETIDNIRDKDHLIKIIHDIQDIWVEAGVDPDIVRNWTKSAFSTARTIGINTKPVPTRPSVLRRSPGGDVTDATSKSGLFGKAGKVVKVLAIVQGLVVSKEAAAHALKGDWDKAAGVLGSYAYDQTIGTAVDAAGAVKDAAKFVSDPLAGIREDVDALKKIQEENEAMIARIFGHDEQKAPPAPPVVVDRPAPSKPDRGNAAQGLLLFAGAFALAATASKSPPESEESEESFDPTEALEEDEVSDFIDELRQRYENNLQRR